MDRGGRLVRRQRGRPWPATLTRALVLYPLGLEPRTCGLRVPFHLCRLVPACVLTCGSVGPLVHLVPSRSRRALEFGTWISTWSMYPRPGVAGPEVSSCEGCVPSPPELVLRDDAPGSLCRAIVAAVQADEGKCR
jgi:hypothetical protein